MNRAMQQKIAALKKMAAPVSGTTATHRERVDSLSKVVRSKKDGEDFMAEVESIVNRARQKSS